jgi:hypothetical protein
MPVRGKKAFCFQGFTLDLERGCLHREGRAIDLRPKYYPRGDKADHLTRAGLGALPPHGTFIRQ